MEKLPILGDSMLASRPYMRWTGRSLAGLALLPASGRHESTDTLDSLGTSGSLAILFRTHHSYQLDYTITMDGAGDALVVEI